MRYEGSATWLWCLVQFGLAAAAFFVSLLAVAMTFPTPPLFDHQLISSVRPNLFVSAPTLGVAALLLSLRTFRATGKGRELVTVSLLIGSLSVGLGLYLANLISRAA